MTETVVDDADPQPHPDELARLLDQLPPSQLGRLLAHHLEPGELARMLDTLDDERVAQLTKTACDRAALQAEVIQLAGDPTCLPDLLYAVRVLACMPQYDFADAVGVTQGTVSARENGHRTLTRTNLAEVVAALPGPLASILCSAWCPLGDRTG
jgi:DNA-binding XRE family transcriptional regulator